MGATGTDEEEEEEIPTKKCIQMEKACCLKLYFE
jgi:hypothetical protein